MLKSQLKDEKQPDISPETQRFSILLKFERKNTVKTELRLPETFKAGFNMKTHTPESKVDAQLWLIISRTKVPSNIQQMKARENGSLL